MDYSLLKSLDQGKIDCLTNETRVLIAVNVVSAILINDCLGFGANGEVLDVIFIWLYLTILN